MTSASSGTKGRYSELDIEKVVQLCKFHRERVLPGGKQRGYYSFPLYFYDEDGKVFFAGVYKRPTESATYGEFMTFVVNVTIWVNESLGENGIKTELLGEKYKSYAGKVVGGYHSVR